MNIKRLTSNIVAGVILLFGIAVPNFVINRFDFAYMENKESLYAIEYLLTSLFIFVFILYLAYVVKSMIYYDQGK